MLTPLLTLRQVSDLVQVHPRTIRRWILEGKFPEPTRLGDAPNSPVRWPPEEIAAWLEQRRAESSSRQQTTSSQVRRRRPR